MSEGDLQGRLEQTSREVERLRAENERLRKLRALAQRTQAILSSSDGATCVAARAAGARLDSGAAAAEKVALIRRLFRHRENVYALRWENPRGGKRGMRRRSRAAGPARATVRKTSLPLSDEAIKRHLRGRESIGIYPLVEDDTCWFLACDLDGKSWHLSWYIS